MRATPRRCQAVHEPQPPARCVLAPSPLRHFAPSGGGRQSRGTLATQRKRELTRTRPVKTSPKMTYYNLDVESFISEVRKRPEIWDVNSDDNRYKSKKQAAWAEIARLFITDFDNITRKTERIDVYRKLHGKWRNIRDSFVRHIKRRDGKKPYMYAKHLSFLNNIYRIKKKNTEVKEDGDTSDDDDQSGASKSRHIDDSSDPNGWRSDEETPSTIVNLKRKRVIKQEDPIRTQRMDILDDPSAWQSDNDDEPPSTIENLKRIRVPKQPDSIEYVDALNATCNYPIEDEDMSFFSSLLPAVRDFDLDQKLEFRSEVICLIKNIRNRNGHKGIKLDPSSGNFI